MRLNRKKEILQYLGKSPSNRRGWTLAKLRYGKVIYLLSPASVNRGYWALSEELDAVDRQEGVSVAEFEGSNLVRDVSTYRENMRSARARGAIR
jgi:hypothetical protein